MQQSIPVSPRAAVPGVADSSTRAASLARRDRRAGVGSAIASRGAAQLLLVGALAFSVALLSACNTSKQASRSSQLRPDTPTVSQAPPPLDDETQEPTIGEQLGRLDARMKTAPADSLPILQEEYQRLLDLATMQEPVQTGGVEPSGEEDDPQPVVSTPRREVPAGEMQGFRTTELKQTGRSESAPAEPRSYVSTPRKKARGSEPVAHVSTPRRDAKPKATASRTAVKETSAPQATTGAAKKTETSATSSTAAKPMEATSNDRDRKFINGVAASRAGKYAEAAKELPTVVSSPPAGKKALAHHTYGEALEKTGNTAKAADQYQKGSKGNDALNHKSYIAYCRTVAKSGDRARARKLLVQFIEKNPKSTQVVNARQLLQTL